MFTKVNAKQEQFLLLVIDGQPAERAYAQVYGASKSRAVCAANASRMLTNVKVAARRTELIEQRHAARPISVEYLTNELVAVSRETRALGQGSAAVQALMGVAKLHGLLVDKVQADVLVRKPSASPESPDDMAPDEWLNQYASAKLIEQKSSDLVEPEHSEPDGARDDGALHE